MKKLMNAPDSLLGQMLAGFAAAHRDLVRVHLQPAYVARATPTRAGKVALVSGGGSGHEPMHAGFVGLGMLDAACPGQVFTSPTPDQMQAAIKAVDGGAGVLLVVKNYEGDVMNFEMAAELHHGAQATVVVNDDVAVEDSSFTTGRRGVAGTVVVEKLAGALAEQGAPLAAVAELARKVVGRTRSMGVALAPCTVPAAGRPTFTLGQDEIELGVGIHGEPGRRRAAMATADHLAATMLQAITDDLKAAAGTPVLLLVNGLGATPLLELYAMADVATRDLAARGLPVARLLVGNWCTALDMAGCSLTVTALDDKLTELWDAPVLTPALRW